MKKIISIILAIITVITVAVPAYAQTEEASITDDSVNEEIVAEMTEQTTETAEITEAHGKNDDDIVAALSVCSCMSTPFIAGHSYIYVQNLSDEPITVGLYVVPVGQGVSVGAFSFSVSDGWGIYYNLEAYRENRDNHSAQIWSKTEELNAEELKNLTNRLKSYLNHWDPFFNCSYFSFSIWNSVTGDFLVPLVIPVLSHLVVMIGGEKGTLEMYYPDETQIFRQRGNGNNAYLELIGDKTLNS